ncbi:hypothetical protein ASY01nite_14000 [Acetobacter syzygii]|uniref:DUF4054 domain-containing protein n=1 Tax=Acetobacter syzygii TaxID=146476 RepID=UPI0005DCCB11|nr:DUF4054 domain-containing protein [Acetobacter syzygii]GAN72114.1 hypothetical protein Absy_030_022 [Acetobacter syzygii]GBR64925.1 hypothetical protein AA0483_1603 [Acetobacter syzygii NRIC 0483]GEL56334.1 hypothetical protein ASY01nite_14000 [Acetobacter syzygii]
MAVATFDYATWSARYPDLAVNVPPNLAALYFDEAQLYLDNTDRSLVCNIGQRTLLLYMLVAHIAYLNLPTTSGGNGAGVVGRVSSATRGSVSIGTDMGAQPGSAEWFLQTQYGAAFWQATLWLRTARYIHIPRVQRQTWP